MITAQDLFDEAFAPAVQRDPRSDAYKQGVLDGIRFKLGELPSLKESIPYKLGTAECDAWVAGVNEGKYIGQGYKDGGPF